MKRAGISIAILLSYFVIRFGLDRQMDQLGEYTSYLFEVGFVAAVGAYYRNRLKFTVPPLKRSALDGLLGLIAGFLVYKLASPLSLNIPFDLQDKHTLALLLVVAPCLEESVFRMALWEPISDLLNSPWAVIIATSAIFSFAHFFAWWSVPEQFRTFVIYQSLYAFCIALYFGFRRYQTGSLFGSILIHFGVNLGFYFGFRV